MYFLLNLQMEKSKKFKMFRRIQFFVSTLIILLINSTESINSDAIKEKHVSAMVYTKWTETPFLLEARSVV